MSIICENCGHTEECCICDKLDEDNQIRHKLEDYQDFHGLTNDKMTDFIRDNDIDY